MIDRADIHVTPHMTAQHLPVSSTGSHLRWLLTACLLLGAAFVRLIWLDRHGLWYDELLTALRAQESASWLLTAPVTRAWPLLYVSTRAAYSLLGVSDLATRIPAAFAGVAGVALIYRTGRACFGRPEGLAAAALLALSPLHVQASRDARYYALAVFLSLFSTVALCTAVRSGKRSAWCAFVLASLLGIYNHPSAWLLLAGQAVFLFTLGLVRRAKASPAWQLPVMVAAGVGLLGLAYLYLLPGGIAASLLGQNPHAAAMVDLSWPFFVGLANTLSGGQGVIALLFVGAALLGLVAGLRSHPATTAQLALGLAVPLLTLPLVRLQLPFVYKYVIVLLPLCLLLVARGVTAVYQTLRNHGSAQHAVASALLVLGVLLAFEVGGTLRQATRPAEAWREMGRFLLESASSGDAIVALPMLGPLNAPSSVHVFEYYAPQAGGIPLQIAASLSQARLLCQAHAHVWLVVTPPYTHGLQEIGPLLQDWNVAVFQFYPDFQVLRCDCSSTGSQTGAD